MSRDNIYVEQQSQVQLRYRFVNKSGETIPPYAVMYVKDPPTRTDSRGPWIYDAYKPDTACEKGQDRGKLMFNGPKPVAAGTGPTLDKKRGWGTMSLPATAKVNSTVAAHDWVGPIRDQWYLEKGGLTHRAMAVVDASGTKLAKLSPEFNPGGHIQFISIIGTLATGDAKIVTFNGGYTDTGLVLSVDNGSPGASSDNPKYGQVKLIQSRWTLDVDYCV